ncbi:MAG: bifunctional ornithine acetyltransferase/N-acetylglutamate synthase, partial [Pseudomonadota bacterium]
MDLALSPLARPFPDMPPIKGVVLRTIRAGYKDWDRADLTYVRLAPGTVAAGVFTKSACASSEVELGREQVKRGTARAVIVNAGNSNAFTGYRGREAVELIQARVAKELTCDKDDVFVSSTGVIGVPLPKDVAAAALDKVLIENGGSWKDTDWEAAANAIGTTDTFPKGANATAKIGNQTINIVGIVKGSGMIAPDMATMLGYVFTDANVTPEFLRERMNVGKGAFNNITVDSDTSTSDTVLAFATCQ